MAKDFDDSFGFLARDAQGTGAAIQTATTFVTQDNAGTPKTSPLSYSSSVITLTVPDDAVQLVLAPSTDLRVSEDSGMARYDLIVAGSKEALPVVLMQSVYLRRDSVDGIVYFRFAKV